MIHNERELMFGEDTKKSYVKLQNMSYRKQILVSSTYKSVDEDNELFNDNPDLFRNKVVTMCTVNLLFDYNYNCYYMTNSYLSREITLYYMEICYPNEYSRCGEEKEVKYTYIDNTPYCDSLYLNDDFLYSFLLFTFIQQERLSIHYLNYNYKSIVKYLYNDNKFMLSIIQIKDYIRDKVKEDFIINEIISYLL
jgi:hypothetical protein